MDRKIVKTSDGSHSLRIEEWDEQYHSKHGAVAESSHVFIKQGLARSAKSPVSILEMGFGTGLNALLTILYAIENGIKVQYTAIEAYPLKKEEWQLLNYSEHLNAPHAQAHFEKMHEADWGKPISISDSFTLYKLQEDMTNFTADSKFDLIYYDAFGYRVQPELWSEQIFKNMFRALKEGGILVTYAAKGLIRRTLQSVGFEVERLPGPPGKREMIRATKIGSS